MTDIDWSKAPEGATHYNKVFRYFCNKDGWWANAGDFVDEPNQAGWGTDRHIPRPQAWKEWELPPVGTHCEATWGLKLRWHECVVLPDNAVAIKDVVAGWQVRNLDNHEFRPIKSEKDRQIERMREIVCSQGMLSIDGNASREIAQGLYEAGCRLPDTDQD